MARLSIVQSECEGWCRSHSSRSQFRGAVQLVKDPDVGFIAAYGRRRMTAPDTKFEGRQLAGTCLTLVSSDGQLTRPSPTFDSQRPLRDVNRWHADVRATPGRSSTQRRSVPSICQQPVGKLELHFDQSTVIAACCSSRGGFGHSLARRPKTLAFRQSSIVARV